MNVWIIYDSQRYEKNIVFAEKLVTAFTKRNIDSKIKIIDKISDINEPLPKIAVLRTTNLSLTKYLEQHGVKTYNNSFVSEITNDKYKTYMYLKENDIPLANTELIFKDNYKQKCFVFPKVVKSVDGHGGNEVFMVNSFDEIENCFNKTNKDRLIIQEVVPDIGKDLRVYVIKNKIICGMLRTSSKDFRSNFSLGGSCSVYNLSAKEKELVDKIANLFDFGLVGMDFIFKNNQLILNEIEDVVGCRMIYSVTNIDIVQLYVDYIISNHINI